MSLDSIVNLNISVKDTAITRAGFGTPLIFADSAPWGKGVRAYTSLGGIEKDGFGRGNDVYVAARAILSQSPRPTIVKVGAFDNEINNDTDNVT